MTTDEQTCVSAAGDIYDVPDQNAVCVFPFVYYDKEYSECTSDWAMGFWCGTQYDVTDDAGWGMCDESTCSLSEGNF